MKTKFNSTSFIVMIIITAILVINYNHVLAQEKGNFKIGTYDSRAVTYAYFNSTIYSEQQKKAGKERDSIMHTKDTIKWEETMCEVFTEQYLMHQRVFATGSAASIIKKIADKLPEVAKKAGVNLIVSKWELSWFDPDAVIIDLTDSIAQLFNPLYKLDNTYTEIKKMKSAEVDTMTVQEVIEMWKEYEEKYLGKNNNY